MNARMTLRKKIKQLKLIFINNGRGIPVQEIQLGWFKLWTVVSDSKIDGLVFTIPKGNGSRI